MGSIRTKTFSSPETTITFLNFDVLQDGFPAKLRESLSACHRQVGLQNIVRQTFFVPQSTPQDEIDRAVAEAWGDSPPPTTLVYEPPADGLALSAELWAFPEEKNVRGAANVRVAGGETATWGFVGGLTADENESPYDGTMRFLKEAQARFESAGLAFGQVVRTWYYIGNILKPQGSGIRYDGVNRARNEFYTDMWTDLCLSPPSTGIGMDSDRIAFEAVALDARGKSVQVTWIDNPLQTPPYRYDIALDSDRKPSFSRSVAIRLGEEVILFVSGTASIRGSEVVFPDDPVAQTKATIENIETLIGTENLARHCGFERGATLEDLQQYRVYVKRAQDVDLVRNTCRSNLPDVPHITLVADVCRAECLMEIELVAAFKLKT